MAEPYHNLKIENFTPVMQQYLNERAKLTGKAILLFRMGDFYEAFFQDAEDIAQELEITLTGRPESNYPGGRIPMAGVPQKAVKGYISRLLERDYKVYIAEQMADPKSCKGLVPREIAKIFTPGTINDLDLLESYRNNFIAAICPEKFKGESESFGLAYADISTGEFYATELSGKFLDEELARIQAAEMIAPSNKIKEEGMFVAEEKIQADFSLFNLQKDLSPFNKANFDIDLARQNLSAIFEVNSVDKLVKESFAPDSKGLALMAAGALVKYFKETLSTEFAQNSSKNFDVIKTYTVSEYMLLDKATRKNLELTESITGDKHASLFATIDKTASKPGRRRLQSWLEQPLYDLTIINARQDSVEEFLSNTSEHSQIHDLLKRTYDIDRLSGMSVVLPRSAPGVELPVQPGQTPHPRLNFTLTPLLTTFKSLSRTSLMKLRILPPVFNDITHKVSSLSFSAAHLVPSILTVCVDVVLAHPFSRPWLILTNRLCF